KFLHEQGAKLVSKETTAAHTAAIYGNIKCLEYSLDHGVTIDALDDKNRTIFSYACQHGQLTTVEFLTKRGIQPTYEDLVLITKAGHVDLLDKIFSTHPERIPEWINKKDAGG